MGTLANRLSSGLSCHRLMTVKKAMKAPPIRNSP